MSTTGSGVIELMPPEDVARLLPPDDGDQYTSLYRLYDEQGALLYVGVARGLIARMGQHRRNARWFRDVTRAEVQHFDSRQEALGAETNAIRNERPKYNIEETGRTIAWDGLRLKRARELAGLTQVELAERLNGSPTTIAKYEQNKAQPSIPALVRLSTLLDVSSDALLGLTSDARLEQPGEPVEPAAKSLAWSMRYARTQRGLMTQTQLSEKTGIPINKINRFERGGKMPTEPELEKIARVLDVSPDWLMSGERED